MLLKGALHTHSTCSDGELSVCDLLNTYSCLGFDFVALTDHDFLLRGDCYERQLAAARTDLMVLNGVELTVFAKGYVHVNRVEGTNESLHIFNHPAELDLPLDKVIRRIEETAQRLPIHAVEVTSKGFYTPEYDIVDIPYPKIATDDAHTRTMCGRAWIELDSMRDQDAIIRAIKAGEFWNCFQTS